MGIAVAVQLVDLCAMFEFQPFRSLRDARGVVTV